ncbi:MDN1 midasin family protein [Coprinopsis cinerea okayama7|uniref:Midasin n=1 Tax=Coprinopsis cinerea (strain Okayama-7 / 130 / ATCC MYA-4618 / FGSC 9003) TaxID=240176 RepID=A8NRC2_COPC7|nr:MDN1 midasin family protein [Coprinopsis cinerea okayama7\|eukprot:XP_001835749.2 MDN1 midasin family protein [Coprinopsis cinerea okayama7\
MTTVTTYRNQNPLAVHLQRQTQHLASVIPPGSVSITELQNASNTQSFLNTLSTLLSNPAYTQIVATLFRPILMDLCARWLEDGKNPERNLCALAYLLEVHEELFPILSRLMQNYFPRGPLTFVCATSLESIDKSRLSAILLAYYRILRANRQLPSQCNWSPALLSTLMWTNGLEHGIRLLAAKCYAIQVGMGDAESMRLEEEVVGRNDDSECVVEYGSEVDGSTKHMDCWILENAESERVCRTRNKLVTEVVNFYPTDDTEPRVQLEEADLSPYLANIEGVLLLKSVPLPPKPTNYIPTPSGNDTLRSLAHHVSLRLPTLLTSAPSAGKALILAYLAAQLYPNVKNQIITIHLADTSLDPRSLLGSYISSTTQPGTFEWKEGVLVRAMREGKWIVLDDVDRASNEVLGTLKPLVESLGMDKWIGGRASIYVPGRGEVEAHEDFMLFATRSIAPSPTGKFPSPTFFGAHKFYETTLQSATPAELETIIKTQFPNLAGALANAAINLWTSIKEQPRASSSRTVGLRELVKFCQRLEGLLPTSQAMDIDVQNPSEITLADLLSNPVVREDLFLEARDVFFGSGTLTASARAATENVARVIAQHLSLDQERCHWLINKKTPDFYVQKDANGHATGLRVGRTYLPARITKSDLSNHQSRPFALHRPAVCLLSRVATAISLNEPVLLTGETGTGKTSAITHMASLLRRPLISLNLSHQTESSDLIGGLKPVDAHVPAFALYEEFIELFGSTFSRKKNEKFETEVRKAVNEAKWKRAIGLWKESVRMAQERLLKKGVQSLDREQESTLPRKRRKLDENGTSSSLDRWNRFLASVEQFEVQHVHGQGKFAFGFVEGPLVKALRKGDWILLDEINLASPETLESVTSLLHGPTASITLTENGELEPIPRHPDFRLFACMNPATDVGKKDLAPNIRARFTEIDVPPPDADKDTLLSIIEQYIGSHAIGDKGVIMNVAEFYMAVKDLVEKRQLADGSNHRPHFSMRSLSRALTFASDIAHAYSLRRAVWEGCLMAFTMVLDEQSAQVVTALAHKHLLNGVRNPRSMLAKEPNPPANRDNYVKFGPFYLEKGPLPEDPVEEYIMTPSVEKKLIDLARIILTKRFPVLIEGPTSSGKTSSIEYLAKRTGHHFIRINNHEHTDIQEYLGSYVSDPVTGKLVFRDGLLVQALRTGSWIVLDELNLAPSEVLEALNRLLDDNRELVIPETQEVVRPHPSFMLFATQNPPGLYGGRKVLSRAFRNRFLEVHFDDVPQDELETILCQRCRIAPSYGKKIVMVFRELQKRRESSRVFESKQGFATLRDLFRWAGRDAVGYQELAENGYMLLAERTRREEDKAAVKEVIETIMGVKIDENSLYDLKRPELDVIQFLGCPFPQTANVIWTKAMQRLFVLVARALKYNEPVLLVGETGSGKTSVCQVFSDATNQQLRGLNCHQNTETADIIGGLRPLRNRSAMQAEALQDATQVLQKLRLCDVDTDPAVVPSLVQRTLKTAPDLDADSRTQLQKVQTKFLQSQSIFEWHDGPLICSMRDGDVFLLDEISLAEDSVLERLNSVLEPARSIVLAEQGGSDLEGRIITAAENFKLIATMNPGGDYGKKELSPALRNRFTEIYVPRVDDRGDLELIIDNLWKKEDLRVYTRHILDFVEWLCSRVGDKSLLGLRDILAWVAFTNSALPSGNQDTVRASHIFHHAAHMTYLDGLGSLPQLSGYSRDSIKRIQDEASKKLNALVPIPPQPYEALADVPSHSHIQLGPFSMKCGGLQPKPHLFTLSAPTTQSNAMRIARACQVSKPVLLEGSPGVGKTSLIAALANITGHKLHRINLSDQTDLVDLFGSDLPVEGGKPGEFAWRDGEFLQALQLGHWVLLDEMNLAPQAVLEGLNAVLDHRSSVYIPELGRTFQCHPSFRIFAAQNPLNQGGGRKGLPKSFVNRFTKVFVEELTTEDYQLVCRHLFSQLGEDALRDMISFNGQLNEQVVIRKTFGREGAPWEFNLRDIIRWGTLCQSQTSGHPGQYLRTIYLDRFRSPKDRSRACDIFDATFNTTSDALKNPPYTISPSLLQIGHFTGERRNLCGTRRSGRILQHQLSAIESIGHCINQSWLSIVVGSRNSGKTQLVRTFANLAGCRLQEIPINNATDTTDILGSFEQLDVRGRVGQILGDVLEMVQQELRLTTGSKTWSILHDQEAKMRSLWSSLSMIFSEERLQDARQLLSQLVQANVCPGFTTYLQELEHVLENKNALGRFEWVDGPLVRAMKLGHWVALDGANLCNPSVLDRLNSLCESEGSLVLSERGFLHGRVQIIKPHKDFRLFMLVDPQHGELSRAMRNRGIEIALVDSPSTNDEAAVRDHLRTPSDVTPHLSIPEFDAVRRGMSALQVNTDAPKALGQVQSPSKSISLSSQRIMLKLASRHDWKFSVPFILRSLSPSTSLLLNRSLPLLGDDEDTSIRNFLFDVPDLMNNQTLDLFRRRLCQDHPELLSFKASPVLMPLDLFLSTSSTAVRDEFSSPHESLFNYLELMSQHYLLQVATKSSAPVAQDKFDSSFVSLSEGIRNLVDTLQEAILSILTEGLSGSVSCADGAEVGLILLKRVKELQETSQNSVFDFSKAHASILHILDVLQGAPGMFSKVASCVDRVYQELKLSTGIGLISLWKAFYKHYSVERAKVSRYTISASRPEIVSSQPVGLRRQIFDVLALAMLRPHAVDDEVWTSLDKCVPLLEDEKLEAAISDGIDQQLLALELTAISKLSSDLNKTCASLQTVINLHLADSSSPIDRLVPYQHLVWSSKNDETRSLENRVRSMSSLLEGLWLSNPSITKADGPGFLLSPLHLLHAVSSSSYRPIPLHGLDRYRTEIRTRIDVAVAQCQELITPAAMLSSLFAQNLHLIASCFDEHFSQGDLDGFTRAAQPQDLREQIAPFLKTTNLPLRTLAEESFTPFIPYVHSDSPGALWLGLGRMLLTLVVPNIPIDPATVRNAAHSRLKEEESYTELQALLHRELEKITTGNPSNDLVGYLESKLQTIRQQLSQWPAMDNNRDLCRVHQFWAEVTQFSLSVLHPSKTLPLLELAKTQPALACLQEKVIQESLNGFLRRMETLYEDFSDVICPIKLAILQFRLGLRLQVTPRADVEEVVSELRSSIVTFPRASSARRIVVVSRNRSNATDVSTDILLPLSAIAFEVAVGVRLTPMVREVESLYERAYGVWSIDQARSREAEERSNSLYRQSKVESAAPTDADQETQEFLELFPEFEDALENTKSASKATPGLSNILPDHISSLMHIHLALFQEDHDKPDVELLFWRLRKSTLETSLQTETPILDKQLDLISRSFQLSLLQKHRESLFDKQGKGNELPNFYLEPNVAEVQRLLPVVKRMHDRLGVLILEWPDQEVLHHLSSCCLKVMELDLHSPVAKALSAMEQLLLQSEDWEIYANRENSLQPFREELIALIVHWRRLELASWQSLLQTEADKSKDSAGVWWFRLYNAAVRGVLQAAGETTVDSYLEELIPLIKEYITSSPLGEYQCRMDLLASFSKYVSTLAGTYEDGEKEALLRASNILRSLHHHFLFYLPKVVVHLSGERVKLEKEIKNFIKLASWKDINIVALKQSAKKSHHQLYKIVRKFREVLKQPSAAYITPTFIHDNPVQVIPAPTFTSLETPSLLPADILSSTSERLRHLGRTYKRFEAILEQDIRPLVQASPFRLPDDLACEIISESRRLASVTCPPDMDREKRTKHLKSIQNQKRKAWSDLLRGLKRVGFSCNLKIDVVRQTKSDVWIHDRQLPRGTDALVEKSEHYFKAIQGCLPALRSSLTGHHSDVTTRDASKGIAFAEFIFHVALDVRTRFIASLEIREKLLRMYKRLETVQGKTLRFYDGDFLPHIQSIEDISCRIVDAMEELKIRTMEYYSAKGLDIPPELYASEDQYLSQGVYTRNAISVLRQSLDFCELACLTEDELQILADVTEFVNGLLEQLSAWGKRYPDMAHALSPFHHWLRSEVKAVPALPPSALDSATDSTLVSSLIDSFLVSVQSIKAFHERQRAVSDDDKEISRSVDQLRQVTALANFAGVQTQVGHTVSQIKSQSAFNEIVLRALPFLKAFISFTDDHCTVLLYWTKALLKLDYVLCSLVQTLCSKGFCAPPEEADEADDDNSGAENAADGVGLGEGAGKNDVSNEIEDESQVEGLQGDGEDPDQNEVGEEDEKGALEMNEDFGGELQDVPDDGEDDDDDESDTSSDAGLDERIEDLDATDPAAVDEKLWGDESGPEDKDNKERTDQDRSSETNDKSEMAAREGKEGRKDENKGKEEAEEEGERSELMPEEDTPMEEPEGTEEDEANPAVSGAPMEEHVPDANTLDLPEDLELGEDGADEDIDMKDDLHDDEDAMEETMEQSDVGEMDKDVPSGDEGEDEARDDNALLDGLTSETDADAEPTEQEERGEREQDTPIAPVENSNGTGASDFQEPGGQVSGDSAAGNPGTSQNATGQGFMSSEERKADDGPSQTDQLSSDAPPEATEQTGAAASGTQEGSKQTRSEVKELPNPLRSLGDAMKEIQHRFEEILNAQEKQVPQAAPLDGDQQTPQLEYLHPDAEDDQAMQALAAAEDQRTAKLEDLQFAQDDEAPLGDAAMDVDQHLPPETTQDFMDAEPFTPDGESTSRAQKSDVEGAVVQHATPLQSTLPMQPDLAAPKADDDQALLDEQVEVELRKWRESDQPSDRTENLWRLYESLTHDLAYALCEQLRLILEPTLATRLKGDYRTGKRLNMKKVISYIASDYTKDKIWLRRTKPSQREYQVLIAIDDSKSMAESHSIHLAYESLALIGKALGRLESGDVAIAKFGEAVELLHGFDDGPFTDQAGAKVLSAFRFNQKATNVLSLLETSLHVLESARERRAMGSSSSTDLWQLEIIISDGMCQDHEKLRTILRRAEEKRIMIVFIILDSLHTASSNQKEAGQRSILNMDRAEFKNVDGRMELQLQKYLDSFPFEYYVVLRDVEALPDVLSSTLKQFFERIAED